jgi:3-phenylpropionate/trans-cinnamate dioxygenase ferredoxin reductase subunit
LSPARGSLTIVGGGFIGLEVAATARHLGWPVTVLEAAPRLLSRSASPELAAHILQHNLDGGVHIRLGARIAEAQVDADRVTALTVDGVPEPVEHVLVGIGAVPETSLAQQAGLTVDNGIAVDGRMVTSDARILAIGDCSSFEFEGRRVRLESVQNANDQAKVAAATLLGREGSYRPLPFFWSDQGALKLQMAGLWREGLQSHQRPGTSPGSFSLFHSAGDRLVCIESANAPMDHMLGRRLLERGVSPDPAAVADPAMQLKALLVN